MSDLSQQQIQNCRKVDSSAKKTLRALLVVAIALAGILILVATAHPAGNDYIEYWSSGNLLLHHGDPYSPAGVFALEKAQGFTATSPLIMLNPPWALFLVAPLGFVGARAGLFLWMLVAVGCVLIFARTLNVSAKDRAFAFVFAPAVACVCSGQGSPFLLLGFSLFLRLHRSHPFLAGASLLLMAIKPHLFLIFWALLLVDCIYRRRFLILAGGASALAAGTAFSMYFDPHIWQHYFSMLRGYKLQQGFLPTASMLFRMLIDVRAFWLLFVPSALAVIWGLWYYARWRHVWDWRIHGMLLMLVTILVSPYGFFSDEIVLLPSVVYALTFPQRRKYSVEILLAINTAALVIVLAAHAALSSRAYLWTPLAWLAWFLYATHRPEHHTQSSPAQLTEPTSMEAAEAGPRAGLSVAERP
ncbi:MAG: glycosyltransferase 87 family protein [Silvibacterium sp.]